MNAGENESPAEPPGGGVRAFVALGMSGEIADAAASFIGEMRKVAGADAMRWTARARLHLTLRFLGDDADRDRIARLKAGLAEIASACTSFRIEGRGAGAFPNLARPRIFWIGLAGAPLSDLAARVETSAIRAGFAPDPRGFTAHLTIGRIRGGRRAASLLRAAIASAAAREFAAAIADSLILYRSRGGPNGAQYVELARFPFAP
jgi:2'-5' RNA ligase